MSCIGFECDRLCRHKEISRSPKIEANARIGYERTGSPENQFDRELIERTLAISADERRGADLRTLPVESIAAIEHT
jgi:hypothetical protein